MKMTVWEGKGIGIGEWVHLNFTLSLFLKVEGKSGHRIASQVWRGNKSKYVRNQDDNKGMIRQDAWNAWKYLIENAPAGGGEGFGGYATKVRECCAMSLASQVIEKSDNASQEGKPAQNIVSWLELNTAT